MTRDVALAAAACVVALLETSDARAEPRTKIADVCTGCFATVPGASDSKPPAPLLVTLHGDWGVMARELHAAWERFAASRGVAVLSLTCPADLGCKRSWWQWNGNPSWIAEQIDRLGARAPIDRERMWVAGWSGGAAYIGMRSQEFERMFAGLVLHGGGIWPMRAGCAPEKAPAFFLAGDQNPLHPHVLKLREHYEACGNDVQFVLLRGADHEKEWSALDKRGGEILDWLATKRRVAVAAPPASVAPLSTGSIDPTTTPGTPTATKPGPPPEQLPPRAGCGCKTTASRSERAHGRDDTPMFALLFALLFASAVRRRGLRPFSAETELVDPALHVDEIE